MVNDKRRMERGLWLTVLKEEVRRAVVSDGDMQMFNGLSDFYRSHEWEKFRQVVIAERMHDDGFVYDEVTGKPIVKKYDIILHHKIFLTEDNVKDRTISLNPDNIMIVSHKTHNMIHEKLGYAKREVFLVYGSPLAGKTTWVQNNMVEGDLIVDIDNIWQCVSGCPRYVKPNRVKSVVFHIRDELIDTVKCRYGRWNNVYIVGGYPLIGERERLCKELGAREIFIDTPKEECLMRLQACQDARDKMEWTKYIEDWWRKYNVVH